MAKATQKPKEMAEIVAVQALSFLATDAGLLGQFLSETGIGPETLRSAAGDPKFLLGVLDFILRDNATVKAFGKSSGLPPATIVAAYEALSDHAGADR
jgi:hypothetical protein